MKSFSKLRHLPVVCADKTIWMAVLLQTSFAARARAQGYDPYAYDTTSHESAPLLERLANSSMATLMMVFAGAAGIFLFATASNKGNQGEKKRGLGLLLIGAVLLLVYYRFTLRNE